MQGQQFFGLPRARFGVGQAGFEFAERPQHRRGHRRTR